MFEVLEDYFYNPTGLRKEFIQKGQVIELDSFWSQKLLSRGVVKEFEKEVIETKVIDSPKPRKARK